MQKWKCFIEKQNKIILTLHRPNNKKAKAYRKEKGKLWNSFRTSNGTGKVFFAIYATLLPHEITMREFV